MELYTSSFNLPILPMKKPSPRQVDAERQMDDLAFSTLTSLNVDTWADSSVSIGPLSQQGHLVWIPARIYLSYLPRGKLSRSWNPSFFILTINLGVLEALTHNSTCEMFSNNTWQIWTLSSDTHPSGVKQLRHADGLLLSELQLPQLKINSMMKTATLGCGFTMRWASRSTSLCDLI